MRTIGYFAIGILIGAILLSLWVWVFQALWNFVIAEVFGGPTLGYWHAYALWLIVAAVTGSIKATVSKK